jgi:hypothetical protein
MLHCEKLISEKKVHQLLDWKHSGFSLDAGDKPIASEDVEGRRRLAEPKRSGDRQPARLP